MFWLCPHPGLVWAFFCFSIRVILPGCSPFVYISVYKIEIFYIRTLYNICASTLILLFETRSLFAVYVVVVPWYCVRGGYCLQFMCWHPRVIGYPVTIYSCCAYIRFPSEPVPIIPFALIMYLRQVLRLSFKSILFNRRVGIFQC
jgi:hypothetical protein